MVKPDEEGLGGANKNSKKSSAAAAIVISFLGLLISLISLGWQIFTSTTQGIKLDIISLRSAGENPAVRIDCNIRNQGFREAYIDTAELQVYENRDEESYRVAEWAIKPNQNESLLSGGKMFRYSLQFKNFEDFKKFMITGRKLIFSVRLQSGKEYNVSITDAMKQEVIGRLSTNAVDKIYPYYIVN